MKKIKLSCTLATYNEGRNIERCLGAVKDLVDEVVVVDGGSTDDTVKIADRYGARVEVTDNPEIFHINKQKANDLAQGEWILQLDADEVVSSELAKDIQQVIGGQKVEGGRQRINKMFLKHQRLIEERDGKVGSGDDNDPMVAYFVPRRNYFLGKFLRYGGTYPDGVIRLFKKNKARLPCKSVHEQYKVDGRVSWLNGDLLHYDSPTFKRYWKRNNVYAERFADQLRENQVRLSWFNGLKYCLWKPIVTFVSLYGRHKGVLDGFQGLVWAVFSGLTWIKAWRKYTRPQDHKSTRSNEQDNK